MEKAEHLTVRSLTIVNDAGEPRIFLEGGTEGSGSSIVLKSKDGKTLQIQEQPDGFITLGIDGPRFCCEVTLTSQGLCIRDESGKLGVTIGEFQSKGFHGLTIYKNGQPVFKLPT